MSQIEQLFRGGVQKLGNPNAENRLEQEWSTAAFKKPTEQAVFLTKTGLVSDDVGDKKHHGGPDKALFAYSKSHYEKWTAEYPEVQFKPGLNGENVSVIDMDETSVYIGDIYQIGEATVQVSQPRRPCWKPGRRVRWIEWGRRIQETGRTGWYFRVLKEGAIQRYDVFRLIERPCPEWSIAEMNDVLYHHSNNKEKLHELLESDYTPISWKEEIGKLIDGEIVDHTKRLYGPNIAE
ncbi:MOSC domain-containing protein [Staphylococcus condimenti]|uniref:MOSC domain-containing protein n=1 Tax=Staphylococcus condimenti TaxID=70255 RepID=A0AB37H0K5_9STAP|nr:MULTISPECIES: MOSC domain-containing protein [Staphylococcus]AMY06143.1 sulfurase [Staphylococcus condimenti]APR60022.1 MOSC domain-containing protein [Staphylococcus condimenti]MDK8646011.1 MOSC domain-containing protein [Staphylococcus condimenti]OFO99503.1 sulfurase [Staphylococcus sp. HMSC065E08]PNZ63848.1 MOSC domain-containing protein [Staphylococcus condimenti]